MTLKSRYCPRPGLASVLLCAVLAGCATLPADFERTESYAYAQSTDSIVDDDAQREIDAHAGQSGYYLLDDGLDAFVARAVLAERAVQSIDAQYYLYHNDLTGALFTNQLLNAAERGVRVRLLIDDMAVEGRDQMAAVLDSQQNVEVRIFNPFSRAAPRATQYVTGFGKVTRRMHNKTFTVDNQVSIVGGRNIGDEYFDAAHDLVFSDLDVMAVGPLVPEISQSFDLYWNHERAYPVSVLNRNPVTAELVSASRARLADIVSGQQSSDYLRAVRESDLARRIRNNDVDLIWGEARVVYDHPEKILADQDDEKYHLAPELDEYFQHVRQELVVISPYFVPGKSGARLFEDLKARGVRVRILTNSLAATDVAVVHAGYMRYRKRLLRAGIEIHEADKDARATLHESSGFGGSSKASLHTKSFIFDRKHVFIGSLNLDPRSIKENTEIGLILDSTDAAQEMIDWFEQYTKSEAFKVYLVKDERGYDQLRWTRLQQGVPATWRTEPRSSFWLRFGVGLMRVLPIESQL
jgi:putative cardiolipin synthase